LGDRPPRVRERSPGFTRIENDYQNNNVSWGEEAIVTGEQRSSGKIPAIGRGGGEGIPRSMRGGHRPFFVWGIVANTFMNGALWGPGGFSPGLLGGTQKPRDFVMICGGGGGMSRGARGCGGYPGQQFQIAKGGERAISPHSRQNPQTS